MEQELPSKSILIKDESLMDKYIRFKSRYTPNTFDVDPVQKCTSRKCKEKVICSMRSGNNIDGECKMHLQSAETSPDADEIDNQLSDLSFGLLSEHEIFQDETMPLSETALCY